MAIYSEAGMIGVVGALLVYMVFSMNKRGSTQAEALQDLKTENRGQSETLENMEGMVIKLIGRWNSSDDKLDRKFDLLINIFSYTFSNDNYPQFINLFPTAKKHDIYTI